MRNVFTGVLACALLALPQIATAAKPETKVDVVVYGGTSGGVAAAVQAARMNRSVLLIEPGAKLGGLTTSGLGWTDSGNKAVIGGIAHEFYAAIHQEYSKESAWVQQPSSKFGRYSPQATTMWAFEPKVAQRVIDRMVAEHKITVWYGERLNRKTGVQKTGARITQITMESGRSAAGSIFIDATYEGDLLAAAGVSYTVGREANSTYGETLNGVQKRRAVSHQFIKNVDPYITPGKPESGLLPGVNKMPGEDGAADKRLQAYNYRVCMTDAASNQVKFTKPAGYDPQQYELLLRNFEAGDMRLPLKIDMMPNRKTDLNNKHAVSTDFIGMNYDYPEASYKERAEILKRHETYIRGLLWTLAYHPRVPEKIRAEASRWGLAKDEFTESNNWPHTAYIREARRMVSDHVHTELDCRGVRPCDEPAGMGSYNMDSHNTQRYVTKEGYVRNEGDIQVGPGGPYQISYRALTPREKECSNLLSPVCVSSSHIAFGSIRMEPVFMILGQTAATAASLAIENSTSVQQIEYETLKKRLIEDGQVLSYDGPRRQQGIDPKKLKGLVLDDADAKLTGAWLTSASTGGFVGSSYLHDNNEAQGEKLARFEFKIKEKGNYELRINYPPNPNRATNAAVTVTHAGGSKTLLINQRKAPGKQLLSLGKFELAPGAAAIEISNKEADGYVIVDAVQAIPTP